MSTSRVSGGQMVSNHEHEHEQARLLASNETIPECVRFQEALDMHREGVISTKRDAAVVAEMARSTFVHRAQGRRSAEDYHKSRQLLKAEEEEILIRYCDILRRTGFPQSVKDTIALAEEILRKRDPTATISPRWLDRSFYKRHPEVKARWSRQLDRVGATHGNGFAALEAFFGLVYELITEFEVKPKNTYTVDETGFVMGNTQTRQVLEIVRHPRDASGRLFPADLRELRLPSGARVQDGSREFATVICCICADGSYLDSAIVMKAEDGLQDSWFEKLDNVPCNILFGVSPNGWTDSSKAMAWLDRNFGHGSVTEKKAAGEWQMLFFDGHISHVNREFLRTCIDYKVLPVCLPPHTPQPLDVSVFSPLKFAYSDILRKRSQAGEKGVWTGNFYTLFAEAQNAAFTPENIRSGFWHAGLVPLDLEVVRRELHFPVNKPAAPAKATRSAPHPQPSSPPRSLSSMSLAEVRAITTPRSQHALHNLTQSLSLDLQSSDSPRTRGLRHAIDKLSKASMAALRKRDQLRERLLQETTESREIRAPKPGRKRRIPADGPVIKNKEIQQHFDGLEAGPGSAQFDKLQKLKDKAAKLDVRVQELVAKKRKYSAVEDEGRKLPATWKSVARLEEEESKEQDRLKKMREDIKKLEGELVQEDKSGSEIEEGENREGG